MMQPYYELVKVEDCIPISCFVHSTNEYKMHIHKEVEIILVVEGSINITIKDKKYLLRENDFMLVNPGEVHSTSRRAEKNICLVFQLDPVHIENYFPLISNHVIDCKSFEYGEDEQERFDIIRKRLAKIFQELNKKKLAYQLKTVSEVLLLIRDLLHNFEYIILEDGEDYESQDSILRLKRIIQYIDDNLDKGVTLEELANSEDMSILSILKLIQ